MKFLVINGPNLNLLGLREPAIYGSRDFAALQDFIRAAAREAGVEVELFQSNHEGAIVDAIQAAYGTADGIVINPAAYTHTSVAILDALNLGRPVITLRNDCFDDVLRLPVGYVVADMEEMAALIRRLAAEYPAGTDPQFARNIALLRREFAVETVAERLREALESFVPELKNPQR